MNCSASLDKIAPAMVQASKEVKNLYPGAKGYGYQYIELCTVIDMLKAVLPAHGLTFVQIPTIGDANTMALETVVMHESGQYISGVSSYPLTNLKGCNTTQMAGSAITYGRRYSLLSIFGIAGDKDLDGTFDAPKKEPTQRELLQGYLDTALPENVKSEIKKALQGSADDIKATLDRVHEYLKRVKESKK